MFDVGLRLHDVWRALLGVGKSDMSWLVCKTHSHILSRQSFANMDAVVPATSEKCVAKKQFLGLWRSRDNIEVVRSWVDYTEAPKRHLAKGVFVIFAQNVRGFETSRPSTDTPFSQPFRSDGMRNVIFCDYSWNQECNKTSETSDVSPDVFSLFLLCLSHICISLCGL